MKLEIFFLSIMLLLGSVTAQAQRTPDSSVTGSARSTIGIDPNVVRCMKTPTPSDCASLGFASTGGGGPGSLCGSVSRRKDGTFQNFVKCKGNYIHNDINNTVLYSGLGFSNQICTYYGCYSGALYHITSTGSCVATQNVQTGATTSCSSAYVNPYNYLSCPYSSYYYGGYLTNCTSPLVPTFSGYGTYYWRFSLSPFTYSYITTVDICPSGYTFTNVSGVFSTSPGNYDATVGMYSCVAN